MSQAQDGLLRTTDPAHQAEVQWLQGRADRILVLQPRLNHIELELAHRGQNGLPPHRIQPVKHLDRAFALQLPHTLGKLLLFRDVGVAQQREEFRLEARDRRKPDHPALSQRVADRQIVGVGQPQHIAGIRLLDDRPLIGKKAVGTLQSQRLARLRVDHRQPALEAPGTDAHEGHAVTVLGIHIGLNLEHKAGKSWLCRVDRPHIAQIGLRSGRQFDESVEELAHPEVGQRAAEEDRRLAGGQHPVVVKGNAEAIQQFHIGLQHRDIALIERLRPRCMRQRNENLR